MQTAEAPTPPLNGYVLPPFDPSYRDAVLSVAYQPSDVGADSKGPAQNKLALFVGV